MAILQAAKLMDHQVIPNPGIVISLFLDGKAVQLMKREYANFIGSKCWLTLFNFVHILYLFTAADIPTFAIPTLLFSLFGALSSPLLTTTPHHGLLTTLCRIPSILLYVWSNLLIFNIANQRLPSAILEDQLNKPTRPLPSLRISALQSRRLLLVALPVVLVLCYWLGPWQETLLLFTLTWMYNDLQGSDEDWVVRNLLIAIGYGLYFCAALRMAGGVDAEITRLGFAWLALMTTVIFSTEHICDLKDRVGDEARGRQSAPIVLGNDLVRWTISVPVVFWSIACPLFFQLSFWGYLIPVAIGLVVALRTFLLRSVDDDALTWKIWALWTIALFSLPAVKEHAMIVDAMGYMTDCLCMGPNCSESLYLVGVSSVAMLVESRRLRKYVFGSELETK